MRNNLKQKSRREIISPAVFFARQNTFLTTNSLTCSCVYLMVELTLILSLYYYFALGGGRAGKPDSTATPPVY